MHYKLLVNVHLPGTIPSTQKLALPLIHFGERLILQIYISSRTCFTEEWTYSIKNLTHQYYPKTTEMITSLSSMCIFSSGLFLQDTGLPSFIDIAPIPGSYASIKTTTIEVGVSEYRQKVGFKKSRVARQSRLHFQPSTEEYVWYDWRHVHKTA